MNQSTSNVSASSGATRRPLVLAAMILAMFMAAVEATIVATAMPSIVGDLGGFQYFSWVFAVFLLAQAITIPIYGKLADLFGRKPVFLVGAAIFLVGSTLSGFSHTMLELILFRTLQGVGAGAVQPIATTVIGDIYTAEERGRIQGYLSSVWGISSIIGPALGAFFVQYVTWSLVFWVNIPIGLASMTMLTLFLDEKIVRRGHQIDYLGAGLLALSVSTIMLVLVQGSSLAHRGLWVPAMLVAASVAALGGFFYQERRAPEPMLPLDIWKNRIITLGNSGAIVSGALMMGITAYLPTYVQGVMGRSPTIAGFALASMSIGWPIAGTLGGRLMFRTSFRSTAILGGFLLVAGAAMLITLSPARGPLWAAAGSFVTGLGMGFSTVVFLVAIQATVPWRQRGVATSSNMFMRILGQSIGAALMGAMLNFGVQHYLPAYVGTDTLNLLMDASSRAHLSANELAQLTSGVASALRNVYFLAGALAVVTLWVTLFIPRQVDTSVSESEMEPSASA